MSEVKRSRILILSGPGFGHYLPIAALVMRLQRPDREIAVAIQVPAEGPLAARVAADGFRFIRLDESPGTIFERIYHKAIKVVMGRIMTALGRLPTREGIPCLAARLAFGLRSHFKLSGHLVRKARALEAAILEFRPDLVLCDVLLETPMAYLGAKYSLQWAVHTVCPVSALSPGRPTYPSGFSPSLRGGERLANALLQRLQARDRRAGSRELGRAYGDSAEKHPRFTPLVRMAFSVPEIDDYPAAQADFRYVGSSLYRCDEFGQLEDGLPDDVPLVYVTLGSSGKPRDLRLYRFVVEQLRDRDIEVYLQINNRSVAEAVREYFGSLGGRARFRIYGPLPRPPYEIYRRANLVIGHGGYNTTTESLYHGIPLLLVPDLAADRMEVARRVMTAEVGECINYYRLDPVEFQSKVDRLLSDTSYRVRACSIGDRLRDGREMAAVLAQMESVLERPVAFPMEHIR